MDEKLKQSALEFHQYPVAGKIQVVPTKPLATQRDLALAYSPGVAAPCLEIADDPLAAYKYTARGNLVGSSLTVPPCWGSATSAPWPGSR